MSSCKSQINNKNQLVEPICRPLRDWIPIIIILLSGSLWKVWKKTDGSWDILSQSSNSPTCPQDVSNWSNGAPICKSNWIFLFFNFKRKQLHLKFYKLKQFLYKGRKKRQVEAATNASAAIAGSTTPTDTSTAGVATTTLIAGITTTVVASSVGVSTATTVSGSTTEADASTSGVVTTIVVVGSTTTADATISGVTTTTTKSGSTTAAEASPSGVATSVAISGITSTLDASAAGVVGSILAESTPASVDGSSAGVSTTTTIAASTTSLSALEQQLLREREMSCVSWQGGEAAYWKYDYEVPHVCKSKIFWSESLMNISFLFKQLKFSYSSQEYKMGN